jgi:hypothetical protein
MDKCEGIAGESWIEELNQEQVEGFTGISGNSARSSQVVEPDCSPDATTFAQKEDMYVEATCISMVDRSH